MRDTTEPAHGWGLRLQTGNGYVLLSHIFCTRSDAIQHYDKIWAKPNMYRRDRRKGEVLAVRVALKEYGS